MQIEKLQEVNDILIATSLIEYHKKLQTSLEKILRIVGKVTEETRRENHSHLT
jgi:hypothetical protein